MKKHNGPAAASHQAQLATGDAQESSTLATLDPTGELAEFFDSIAADGIDGLGDVGGDDIRLPMKLWNMRGKDPSGRAYPRDVFFDTVTEETSSELECVLLTTTKTRRWDEFDNGQQKTIVQCQSSDRLVGVRLDGSTRPCSGCPDNEWLSGDDGKPYRRCGEVHTVVAIERATQRPFLIRFKKTSLKPFRNHVTAHHWGARVVNGTRQHVPLFAYACTITLEMHDSGNYALPILTRGALLPRDEMRAAHESAKSYLSIARDVIAAGDKEASRHDGANESGSSGPGITEADFRD